MTMTLYTFIDADDNEFGTYTTTVWAEAERYAKEHDLAVVSNEFEWSDSEVAADYRHTAQSARRHAARTGE